MPQQATVQAAQLARYIGESLIAQGRIEEAHDMAALALTLAAEPGESSVSRRMMVTKRFMGMVLALQEDWSGADAHFVEMGRELADRPELRRGIIDSNPFIALIAIKQGRGADVRAELESKYTRLQKRLGDQNVGTARVRSLLALARAQMGEKREALKDLSASVPVLVGGTPASDADEDDSNSYAGIIQREILEAYMALLADYQQSGPDPDMALDPIDISFRMADIARGSIVQKALAASGVRALVGNEKLSQLIRTEQDERKSIAALNSLLADVLGHPPAQQDPQAIADMRAQIKRSTIARAKAIADIGRGFPDYQDLINPQPATINDARKVLGPAEALISTYFAKDRGYVWAVNAEGKTGFSSIALGSEEIGDMVADLRYALDPSASGLSVIPEFDLATAHQLYAQIFEPLEAVWKKAENLIFVAHGPLGSLPISLLPTKPSNLQKTPSIPFAEYRRVPWLANSHSVTLIPSVAALTAIRRLPAAKPGRAPFIGFGDPYFNVSQANAAQTTAAGDSQSGAGIKMRGVNIMLRSVSRGAGLERGELARLPRLPDTAAEVKSIADVLKGQLATALYLGRDASEANVKALDLSKFRVLTFATHGLVPGDLKGLTQPALALSAPAVTGDAGDGLLTMEEILNIKLDADWVILSACNTATGDGAGAEAVSGLGQAFFYAGTRSLLASNWPVETVSAKVLTTEIFRIQSADATLGRAQALRQSMVKLMQTGVSINQQTGKDQYAFAHPIFWAPFSLIGDGR